MITLGCHLRCWCSMAIVWLRTSLHVTVAPPRVGKRRQLSPQLPSLPAHQQGLQGWQGSAVCQSLSTLAQGACHRGTSQGAQVYVLQRDAPCVAISVRGVEQRFSMLAFSGRGSLLPR
jgi:hypothetical protein